MSISGYLIALEFNVMTVMPDQVTPAGQWTWRLSHQVGDQAGGLVFVPLGAHTESELLSLVQSAAVVAVNNATNNVEEFTVSDVRGGSF
jgi:hypothetical protein